MAGITLRTARQVVPMIYAYTTPEIARHNGWTKIGYTEQSVDKRLKQQTHTADVLFHEEWRGNAVYDDGSGEVFTDHDFHAYLRKLNVENDRKNEWFHLDGQQSRRYFQDFRMNRGRVQLDAAIAYTLREEQARAVHDTEIYYQSHPGGEYLWNAKPRFGKTLSVYDFCKQVDAQTVLIVTNRPAIANSWYSDYVRFLGRESGYLFVSHVDALAGQPHVLDEQGYLDAAAQGEELYKRIEFVSLQDMKGSKYFGGEYDKLRHLTELNWDVLVIDEAHEGVDTYKTDLAFDRIRRKFTLHLSGTPFKALANDKFAGDAIFNWTYADEQAAKRNWQGAPGQQNPYANLPMLNLYTYQMSEIIRDEIQQGVEIDGETQEFAFDLNEFFKVKSGGSFEHEAEVDRFLDAMTTQNKFPFSTPELRAELKHTFWLLNRVDSARALAKKLQAHPVFRDYEVILAAGDGKLDDTDENQKSFDRVKAAIAHHEKTITLSVGQLTTGVTIPEWSAVLMLSNLKSPALYPADRLRQCVFAGTTNRQDFLPRDRTGNRRFIPVPVDAELAEVHILDNEEESRAYIDQLWAEAMTIYNRGNYKLAFSPAMQETLQAHQQDFMQEDAQAGMIYAFLEDYTGDRVCSKQLYAEALGNTNIPAERETRAICEIMNTGISRGDIQGWQAHKTAKRYPKYGVQKGWERVTSPETGAENFSEITDAEAKQLGFPF